MLHPWPQSAAPLGRRTAVTGRAAAGASPVAVRRPVGAKNGRCRVVAAATTRIIHADGAGWSRGKVRAKHAPYVAARLWRVLGPRIPNPQATSHERQAVSDEPRAASRESRTPVPESRIPNPEPRFPAAGRRLPFWQFPRPSSRPPRFIFQPRQGRLIVATRRKSKIRPSSWWTRGSPADRDPPFFVGAPAGATERRSIAPTGLQTEKRCMNVGTPLPRACAPWLLSIVPSALAFESFPQRRMPNRPCKNRQIRVKIDQKGDVFRQKAIKIERISSCPS